MRTSDSELLKRLEPKGCVEAVSSLTEFTAQERTEGSMVVTIRSSS